jgi:transposase, IS6 family
VRGIEVDHVTVYRWVQTFTPELIHAARPARPGDRCAGLVPPRAAAAREFFVRALRCRSSPIKVTSDRAPVYPRIVEEFEAAARHVTEPYANNPIVADHARFKARLRPMLGLKRLASARTIAAGQCLRAEPAPRPLRDHRQPAGPGSIPRCVRPPCSIPLIRTHRRRVRSWHAPPEATQQCRSTYVARKIGSQLVSLGSTADGAAPTAARAVAA